MNNRTSAKRTIGNNRWGFIALPVVFVSALFLLAYFALGPVLTPVFGVARMFMSSSAPTVNLPKNLLESVSKPEPAATPVIEDGVPARGTIPLSGITMPAAGDQYGQLTVSGTTIDAPVFWGDDVPQLNAGIGTYMGGDLPGFPGTIMLAGHTGTWLYDMESVELGAVITVETHYGTYTYEVVEMMVKDHEDPGAYDFSREDENIIIYTCYPFHMLGLTPNRYFVYGKPLSGPVVDEDS